MNLVIHVNLNEYDIITQYDIIDMMGLINIFMQCLNMNTIEYDETNVNIVMNILTEEMRLHSNHSVDYILFFL